MSEPDVERPRLTSIVWVSIYLGVEPLKVVGHG